MFFTGFVVAAWFGGGMDLFHHFLLRAAMVREGVMPWRWNLFLNFCVELAWLRKVGDGYIFIHRFLLEHLADSAPAIATPQKNDGLPPVAFKRIEDWRSLMIIAILTTG
jgi:hypothetical protein